MGESGKLVLHLNHKAKSLNQFTGEYECRVDAKGRLRLPSALIRQIGGVNLNFTVNRGFEQHLIMYPKEVWERKTKEINQLNIYSQQHRQVIRYFYRGATEVQLDTADRVLIPKSLLEYAEISKEVMLFAYQDQIEIWSKERYKIMLEQEPEDFSSIADKVFGNNAADV